MNDVDTFNKLKRVPHSEMAEKISINNFKSPVAPEYKLGNTIVQSSQFYNRELSIHYWRIQTFEDNGWTFEDFMLESEKKAIRDQIEEFNKENQIPQELIDRAKTFFPNVKFIHASVELE
jgi:hypothetical protein